jgi:hypothetical protein
MRQTRTLEGLPLKLSSCSLRTIASLTLLLGAGWTLTGCNLTSVQTAGSGVHATTSMNGVVHGGENPVGGSLVQLWETGSGSAPATATAVLGTGAAAGTIASITVNAGGNYGYTSAPTVTVSDSGTGTGTGATATANIANGNVTSITVTSPGANYTAPVVSVTGGTFGSGYGSGPPTLIASTTTAAVTGAFSFPNANVPANCQAGPYAYITASGGDPTAATTNNVNTGILLVGMIGPCTTTGANTSVVINELTTVAAAYALGNFATDTSGTVKIGASSTNAQGLADAVANAGLLVNISTGSANPSTASVALPGNLINALGNSLVACVNSTSSGSNLSTSCANLYSYTTPPPSGTAPADVFQAAMNMAKYPGNNVSNILSLAGSTPPFQPTLNYGSGSSVQNDLTLGISYPNVTMQGIGYNNYLSSSNNNAPVSIAIDGSDNVWEIGATNGTLDTSHYNYISELTSSSAGATLTNTLGSTAALDGTHTVRTAAFDTAGNMFLSDKSSTTGSLIEIASGASLSSATELTAFTTLTLSTGSLDPNDWWVAVDASNNPWTASYGGAGNCTTAGSGTVCDIVEYTKSGSSYTPGVLFGGAQKNAATSRGGAVDTVSTSSGFGNVWSTNYGIIGGSTAGTSLQVLKPSTGALSTITLGSTASRPEGVALDASGNGFITTNATAATSGLWLVPQGTGTSTISSVVSTTGQSALTNILTTGNNPASTATTALQTGGLSSPGYDAVDGAGRVWVANNTYGTLVEYDPVQKAYLSPFYGFSPSLTTAPTSFSSAQVTIASGTPVSANIYAPNNVAIGQTVTLSGFTGSSYTCLNGGPYTVTALGGTIDSYFSITLPGTTCTAQSKSAVVGTVTVNSSTQALFTCTGTSTIRCSINAGNIPGNTYIGIDRAGTVWTFGAQGTLTGIIGTAAPTNPVLAAGQAGVLP